MIIIRNLYLLFIIITYLAYTIKKQDLFSLLIILILLKGVNYNPFLFTILLIYKCIKEQKYKYVKIKINNKIIKLKGFIDTGNNIKYKDKYIVILSKKYIDFIPNNPCYVYYNTIDSCNIMPCLKPDYIYINFIKYNNILVGIAESNNFDLILNPKIWEE